MNLNKIVFWEHKYHTHTHSYIYYGFKRAFEHLGYKTEWYGNDDDVSGVDFSNSLFFVTNDHEKVPKRNDCYYVLHNPTKYEWYSHIDAKRKLLIQVHTIHLKVINSKKIDDGIYFDNRVLCFHTK